MEINKGDDNCARCKEMENDIHMFFTYPYIMAFIQRFEAPVKSEGRAEWNLKCLLIGYSIGCSFGLWSVLRMKILWVS